MITVTSKLCSMITLTLVVVAGATFAQKPGADTGFLDSVTPKPDLYPANADARKEIDEALKGAAESSKRVLLIFGANWCYDCHVLAQALHQGEAGEIVSDNFLLVHVDVGEGEKNPELVKLYKIPLDRGVPAVAILAGDGRLLYRSGQGEFEAARRMMKRDLIAFLKKWQTKSPRGAQKEKTS